MSKEIAVSEKSEFPVLDPASEVGAALAENAELGVACGVRFGDLPRVSMPSGGAKVWSFVDADGNDQSEKEIVGALCYAGVRGALWPTLEPSGSNPFLVTSDCKVGRQVGEDHGDLDPKILEEHRLGPRTFNWETLPYCQFGSGPNGRGKRCKESRVLAVLQPGESLPLLVQTSPASCKVVDQFLRRVSLKVPLYRCVIGLSLEKTENAGGQPYSVVKARFIRALSPEEGAAVKTLFFTPLAAEAKGADHAAPPQEEAPF